MQKQQRNDYLRREDLLEMLSDEEIARISQSETGKGLSAGDEYIDLERLAQGVHRAQGPYPIGRVLPKKAVAPETWSKILSRLGATRH